MSTSERTIPVILTERSSGVGVDPGASVFITGLTYWSPPAGMESAPSAYESGRWLSRFTPNGPTDSFSSDQKVEFRRIRESTEIPVSRD